MKIELYLDIWPGLPIEQQSLYTSKSPGKKYKDVIRYKLTAEIPDPCEPDATVEAELTEVE